MSSKVLLKSDRKQVVREGNVVSKVFAPGKSMADVLNEALNQSRVQEGTDLVVPEVLGVQRLQDGSVELKMTALDGKTLAACMEEDPENWKKYLDQLLDVHEMVLGQRGLHLRELKAKLRRQIKSLSFDTAGESVKFEMLSRMSGTPNHNKLCHGDLVPENVLILEDGSYAILDWSHAAIGNGAADVARTYLRLALKNREQADYYIENYAKRSHTIVPYIQHWIPVVAAAQLSKQIPEERELLLSWINVSAYQ